MPEVYWVRPPSRVAIAYEEWRDDASCYELPTELFELGDPDEITDDDQQDLIAQGLKVCAGCPVRAACRANSSELDRYWTTRGGQPPEGLFPEAKEPKYAVPRAANGFKPGQGPKRAPKKYCKRGHDDWFTRPDGKRRCQSCRKLDNQKGEERRKAKTLKGLRERGILTR